MEFLDAIEGVAGERGDNAKVAGGLMEALDEHPGGLAGVMDSLKQNGMEQHLQELVERAAGNNNRRAGSARPSRNGADRACGREGWGLHGGSTDGAGDDPSSRDRSFHARRTSSSTAGRIRRHGFADPGSLPIER